VAGIQGSYQAQAAELGEAEKGKDDEEEGSGPVTLRPNSGFLQEADREKLNQLLRDPLLVSAIDIAIREAQPNSGYLSKLPPEQQAAVANQLAGMTELVRRLEYLSSPIVESGPEKMPSNLGEWSHLEEEEIFIP